MSTKAGKCHGETCIACNDPDEARRQIAEDRAGLETQAVRAEAHREAGEAARREYLKPGITDIQLAETQARMLYHLGTANAIAQGIMMQRAQLDRVEAAHPALRVDAMRQADAA